MPAPSPGKPVRGSSTGRPIMAALDLLGRRWALRIIWELRDGPLGFRPLQQRCDNMSSSVLRVRLTEFEGSGLIQRTEDASYTLTPMGHRLRTAIRPLTTWANSWAHALADQNPAIETTPDKRSVQQPGPTTAGRARARRPPRAPE